VSGGIEYFYFVFLKMLSYSKRRFLVSSLAASLFLSFRRSLCRAVVVLPMCCRGYRKSM
jgi:hypothetical protein